MHGDFSLNPLAYRSRVSRVLHQMGRVQLDSDANEQTESTLRFLRGLAMDVIGYHGALDGGFRIIPDPNPQLPFRVAWGHYYVDGIRCVNMPFSLWNVVTNTDAIKNLGPGLQIMNHPDSFWDDKASPDKPQLLYLAVWERHISSAEHEPLREVALGGPDTASRALVTWQIRTTDAEPIIDLAQDIVDALKIGAPATDPDQLKLDPIYLALGLRFRSGARLKAFAKKNEKMDPCTVSPEARYRGTENRLYRVEIHQGGDVNTATFKWSPDNASIVYPVRRIEGKTVYLDSLGRDERTAIMKNDWVEVVDDRITLTRQINKLIKIVDVDRHQMFVTLSEEPQNNAGSDPKFNPILRRWAGNASTFKENVDIELSDGVIVQFSHVAKPQGLYRPGDYWLIPTRIATGNVIWPGDPDNPPALAPHGIDEHYAPLAMTGDGRAAGGQTFTDLRWRYQTMADPVTPFPP